MYNDVCKDRLCMFDSPPKKEYDSARWFEYSVREYLSLMEFNEIDDPDQATIEITAGDASDKSEIKKALYEEVVDRCWWLQNYWRDKGEPTEQIVFGKDKMEIFFFSFLDRSLQKEETHSIQNAIESHCRVLDGKAVKRTRFMLFDNNQKTNRKNGKAQNSKLSRKEELITLYPTTLKTTGHRVPKVNTLEGALIHELTHYIYGSVLKEWKHLFGWYTLDEPEELKGDKPKWLKTKAPKRCVTDYAQIGPIEDVAESVVAALQNPEILDDQKLEFIQDNLLSSNKKEPTVEVKKEDQPKVGVIQKPVTYHIEKE